MSRPDERGPAALLDAAFGFLVWAIHLVAMYATTAMWCRFTLPPGTLVMLLVIMTLAAVAIVGGHALWRYRRDRASAERSFRLSLTVGVDAIAALAIGLQLLAVGLIPACV